MVNKDNFREAGPKNFTASNINWDISSHRRAVAACLVKAVVVLHRERNGNSGSHIPFAQEWWEAFGFSLDETIMDTADSTVFGAVFSLPRRTSLRSPELVVAFRGSKNLPDIVLDIKFITNRLHPTSRCKIAVQKVDEVVSRASEPSGVWLAGHSLGAALAMAAGRIMAMKGILLESYLFNPPFPEIPYELFGDGIAKTLLRKLKDSIKSVFLELMEEDQRPGRDYLHSFHVLSKWVPNLFVNAHDILSMEYKGHFEHMEKGPKQMLSSTISFNDLCSRALGKESKPIYLIPSAILSVNSSNFWLTLDFDKLRAAHGIQQWWNLDLELSEKEYKFN